MLVAASVVFLYYSIWTLAMVQSFPRSSPTTKKIKTSTNQALQSSYGSQQPFVDLDHPLHSFFPPREWAIRIPVILILLGSAVVGSFLSVVMIRSNRKKTAKAKAAASKKKA